MIHKPIVIVGSGPVGMTIAIKLAKAGYKEITLLDANVPNNMLTQQDGRVLALSYASRQILENIKAWDNDCATAINQVHISHSGLGVSSINSNDVTLPELGYTIKYSDLCTKLYQCAQQYPEIKLTQALVNEVIPGKNYATIVYNENETLTANWVILAEGGKVKPHQVEYKEYDYKQSAIIAPLKLSMSQSNIAFERFDDNGALVLLPYKDEYILVWSVDQEEQESLIDPEQLTSRLSQLNFMQRFGQFKINGKIHSFPLCLQVAKKRVIDRVILVRSSVRLFLLGASIKLPKNIYLPSSVT